MQETIKKISKRLASFRAGKIAMGAIILIGVLIGYNSTFTYMRTCSAAGPLPTVSAPPVIGGNCICCTPYSCPQPCDPSGTASNIQTSLVNDLESKLEDMANAVESDHLSGVMSGIAYAVDSQVLAILNQMNQIEINIISWWEAMWYYNAKPAMQQATRQLNTANVDQVRAFQGAMDVVEQSKTMAQQQENEVKAVKTFQPSEQVCVGATEAGGLGRASEFSKGVRKALERSSRDRGLNKQGTPSAKGIATVESARHDTYEGLFCDPNGGNNPCAGDPNYYNADTQVTRQIYNTLTINMDDDAKVATTVEAIMDNLVGTAATDPIPRAAFDSSAGRATFMSRRSYLARHAAVKSVPQLIVGWRTPGSSMGPWVEALRKDAGNLAPGSTSDNPSYREIVHAMTIDRFNSTEYANKMITSQSNLEKEKLMLSAFYLMQLRDYYELLERQALTLVVQVSMLAEMIRIPDYTSVRPVR